MRELLSRSRKTERGAGKFLAHLVVRPAPFALLSKSPATKARAHPWNRRCANGIRSILDSLTKVKA